MSYNVFCFFNDTATTEIYTLSLHDALPILVSGRTLSSREVWLVQSPRGIESRDGSGSRVVELSGDDLTIEDVVRVARRGAHVEVSRSALERVRRARDVVDSVLERGDTVYGMNTGVGSLS